MYAMMHFIVKDTHFPFLYYSALPPTLSLSFVEAQTCAHSVCYALIGCHSCHADRAHQPLILCDPTRLVAHVVPFTGQRETARTSPSTRLLQEGTRCRPWKKWSSGHVMFNLVCKGYKSTTRQLVIHGPPAIPYLLRSAPALSLPSGPHHTNLPRGIRTRMSCLPGPLRRPECPRIKNPAYRVLHSHSSTTLSSLSSKTPQS